jgi:hypothetical protein
MSSKVGATWTSFDVVNSILSYGCESELLQEQTQGHTISLPVNTFCHGGDISIDEVG